MHERTTMEHERRRVVLSQCPGGELVIVLKTDLKRGGQLLQQRVSTVYGVAYIIRNAYLYARRGWAPVRLHLHGDPHLSHLPTHRHPPFPPNPPQMGRHAGAAMFVQEPGDGERIHFIWRTG